MDAQIKPAPEPEPELPHRYVVESYPGMTQKEWSTKAGAASMFGKPMPVLADADWEVVLTEVDAEKASAKAIELAKEGAIIRAAKHTLH